MAKYTEWLTKEGLLKIEGWARDGLTDEQISGNIGVAYSTLRDWKNKFPAFSAALKKGGFRVFRVQKNEMLRNVKVSHL